MLTLRSIHAPLVSLAALLSACNAGDVQMQSQSGATFLFVAPAPGTPPDLRTVPWPSDLYLDAGGHIAMASFTPLQTEPLDDRLTADLAHHAGFSVATGAFFPVSAALDEASLDGKVQLVDLDAGSTCPAIAAAAVPVVTVFRPDDMLLHVRPANGHVLIQQHHHAFVITKGITAGGAPVAASPDLQALLSSTAVPSDPRLGHAHAAMKPLLDRLDCFGGAGNVIAAAVFTTQNVTQALADARAALYAGDAPVAQVAWVFADAPDKAHDAGSLDDLMGKPAANRPGADNPGGIAHDGMAFVVQGGFVSPDFLAPTMPTPDAKSATTSLPGPLHFDDTSGKPSPLGRATVPFTLVLPKQPMGGSYANLPVVVFQHGLGGDRIAVLAVANTLARAGLATIGIEIPAHGMRQAGAVDKVHNITGADGPDGFAETTADASQLFFDILGDKARGIVALDPPVIRGAFQQASIDLMSEIRLVTEGSFAALGQADARLAGLAFRKGQIVYSGESFGSILGGIVSAEEPKVGAAVLSVGGAGLIFPLLTWSVDFGPIFDVILQSSLGVNSSPEPPESDFGYNLLEFLLETGDPIAFTPYVIRQPLQGAQPRHVLLLQALHDEAVPNISAEALAGGLGLGYAQTTAGGAPTYRFAVPQPGQVMKAPLSGNVTAAGASVTAAIVQFEVASHGMITEQRGTRTHDTTMRPFQKLAAPQPVMNPIEALQAMFASFATDFYAGKTPTVTDPQ